MYYFADTFLKLYSRHCQIALTILADDAYVAADAQHSEAIAFFRTGVVLFQLENISDRDLRYLRHGNAPLIWGISGGRREYAGVPAAMLMLSYIIPQLSRIVYTNTEFLQIKIEKPERFKL